MRWYNSLVPFEVWRNGRPEKLFMLLIDYKVAVPQLVRQKDSEPHDRSERVVIIQSPGVGLYEIWPIKIW